MKNQFNVGDLVWAKVHGHPWWPSIIYDEVLTTTHVKQAKKEGFMLVSFFGDNSYKWLDPKKLVHFESNYGMYSKRSSSRLFIKAVSEAVYEVNHRAALGLICPCSFFSSYRPVNVEAFLEVDIDGYQSGGVYTMEQIQGFKQEFQPVETLSFVQLLALDAINVLEDLNHIKEVARVLAFRKAKYSEVDEPYFLAFGVDPGGRGGASNGQEMALVQAPADHSSKAAVKYRNKKKRCLATQEDKLDATKTIHTVKRNQLHDTNSKSSQDQAPQKKRRANVEVEKKLDIISATDDERESSPCPFKEPLMPTMDDKKVESLATPTKCDDVEKVQSFDPSVPSKTRRMHKICQPASKPFKKRRRSVSTPDSPKIPLALSSKIKRKKGKNSTRVVKAPQEGPETILSMKFPPDTSLPSASELKAKFAVFGAIDVSSIHVSYLKSRCQVVFLNKSDAEKAYEHAVNFKNMFGQTNVSYRLRPKFTKPDLLENQVTPPHAPVTSRMASVCRTTSLYQEIYTKYRELGDQTRVQLNEGSVDISEKMLYLLNECSRIVFYLKQL